MTYNLFGRIGVALIFAVVLAVFVLLAKLAAFIGFWFCILSVIALIPGINVKLNGRQV